MRFALTLTLISIGLVSAIPAFAAQRGGPETGVYRCLLDSLELLDHPDPQAQAQIWRIREKDQWRRADATRPGSPPERRVKIKTNIQRRAGQRGGLDESADAAPPFTLKESDPRPPGMPAGTYWLNSGQYGFISKTLDDGLRGGPRATQRFEIVYMYKTPDGKIVHQSGGYAAPDSSWGWDGRFELQPTPDGKHELVITQGAMELPKKMEGAGPDAKDLPEIQFHNFSRSRHVFKPIKFENGKLYVLDEGSILENHPVLDPSGRGGDWIAYETKVGPDGKTINVKKHAHGYGENFFPDDHDPRKLWEDESGYPVRVFDEVTEQTNYRTPNGRIHKVPSATRSVAYRMDPKNPSKRVPPGTKLPNGQPADQGIVIFSEENPATPGKPFHSTIRMPDTGGGVPVERRTLNPDGTVTVEKNPAMKPHTLVEGYNPVPGVITLPNGKQYYLVSGSASEYTAGAIPASGKKEWRYGTYLGFRTKEEGRLGQYHPVTENGDLADALEDFTELYELGWGAGRPQFYQDEAGKWWVDVHAVDIDLLPKGSPVTGYPASAKDFADNYRRHKISIPIRWTERNGMPWFEIDDPQVQKALEAYRKQKALGRR